MTFITGPLWSGKRDFACRLLGCTREELSARAVWDVQELAAGCPGQAGLEARLAELIAQVEGAGQTTVMVTLESTEERIYATDTRTGQDQSQQTHVLLEDGTALEETTCLPAVRGVAVVCDGGGNVEVEVRITALVSALLDLPANRICVEQRSGRMNQPKGGTDL